MEVFDDRDVPYLTWLHEHPNGFVLNRRRGKSNGYLFCIVLGVARLRTTTTWLAPVDLLRVHISKFALIPLQNSNSMRAQRVGAQMVHSVASVRYVAHKAMPNPTVHGTIQKLRLCLACDF